MSGYAVKSIEMTVQGEGRHAGRPAVFLRFAGCNLWTGREADRHKALCRFCDTDFVGVDGPGGGYHRDAQSLADAVAAAWNVTAAHRPYVVCTGGEPMLQFDEELLASLHAHGFEVAIETNGTRRVPEGVDWICVSPKAGAELVQTSGHELKLVYPQNGLDPEIFEGLDFRHAFLQPMDGDNRTENTRDAVAWCLAHPRWLLSLQTHKVAGIP